MKTIKFFSLALLASIAMYGCGDSAPAAGDAEKVSEAGSGAAVYQVNTAESELQWHGSKLAYGHSGTIKITQGSLSIENNNLTAGNFTVDMKSIQETGNDDAESAAKLVGHLMSADFFDSEKYPESKFEVTGSTANVSDSTTHTVKGNLTIKGIAKNIEFPAKITVDGDNLTAWAKFSINRNDWGVTYGSGLSGAIGDKIISDNIDYNVTLKGKKQAI